MANATPIQVTYVIIGVLALLPIYFGSFASLKHPVSAPLKPKKVYSPDEDTSSDEDEPTVDMVSSDDAWMFPIGGSVMLVGLYVLFKYLNKDYLNYLFTAYFGVIGVFAVSNIGASGYKGIARRLGKTIHRYHVVIKQRGKEVGSFNFTAAHVLNCCLGVVMYTYYAFTKNWIMSNLFGLAVAFNSLEYIQLDTFMAGFVLLGGLFFYDIFFVFGTNVMVTVAVSMDVPIKIMVPKEYIYLEPSQKLEFSMLGLGDIVVPGLFIALALRYDLYRFHQQNPTVNYKRHMYRFPKPYFISTFAAYIAGLVLTMTVMHVFKKAQPALLYLSPFCAASALLTALVRRELPALWGYKEISKEDRIEELKEKEAKEKESKEKEEVVKEDGAAGDVKYQAQAIRKKTAATQVSGHGGDVESLDDNVAEDGEAIDSEWTQGGEGDEWTAEAPVQTKRRARHDEEREGWTSGGDLADVEETPRSRSDVPGTSGVRKSSRPRRRKV